MKPYAGPVFYDQYVTAEEYAKVIGCSPRHVRRMAQTFVFAEFGIPTVAIPQGRRGRYRQIYIYTPASLRS